MVMFSKMNKELALQEAASIGLKTMEHLIKLAANESVVKVDCREITDFVVAKLKKANAMAQNEAESQAQAQAQAKVYDSLTTLSLSSYGYMDKERVLTPTQLSVVSPVHTGLTLDFRKPSVNAGVGTNVGDGAGVMKWKEVFGSMENSIGSSSFLSSIIGKQPSATEKRCREQEKSGDGSGKKRVYYKCTNFSGCPAKKHVERAMEDPMMLIVTYKEEHHHTQAAMQKYNSQMMAFGSIEGKKE
ncbi:hypothetical protein FXO37_34697 [Capsicum annuum]|nr:hypothetical protein FXO37_34697 [Capsicum annuum]